MVHKVDKKVNKKTEEKVGEKHENSDLKQTKKRGFQIFSIIMIVLALLLLVKVGFDTVVEGEKLGEEPFFFGDGKMLQFNRVVDGVIQSSDPQILKTFDADFKPLLSKYFGEAKLDDNLIISSQVKNNYHLFYFTRDSPRLEDFYLMLSDFEKNPSYVRKETVDSRTTEFVTTINKEQFKIYITALSFNNDDSIGSFMIYIAKLN